MENDKDPKYAIQKSIEDGWKVTPERGNKPSELYVGEWSRKCKRLYRFC